jgi:hypothetical protein
MRRHLAAIGEIVLVTVAFNLIAGVIHRALVPRGSLARGIAWLVIVTVAWIAELVGWRRARKIAE